MPMFDGTGPHGYGPMTGCGMGKCQQEVVIERQAPPARGMGRGPGFCKGMGRGAGNGQGAGNGMGRGRGMCQRRHPQDKQTIQNQIEGLRKKITILEKELKTLDEEHNKNG